MLESLLGGLVSSETKQKAIASTIQSTLEDLSEELQCDFKSLFVMIKPIDTKFNHKFFVYKQLEGKAPEFVREISLKEIVED